MEEDKPSQAGPRIWTESIEVTGSQVVDQVKRMIKHGNVHQLRINAKDSDFSQEMPTTPGLMIGGAMALTAPWLAMQGVIAGLVSKVVIEVEREATSRPQEANRPRTPKASGHQSHARKKGHVPGKLWFRSATCPKCAKAHGQNPVVGVVKPAF